MWVLEDCSHFICVNTAVTAACGVLLAHVAAVSGMCGIAVACARLFLIHASFFGASIFEESEERSVGVHKLTWQHHTGTISYDQSCVPFLSFLSR